MRTRPVVSAMVAGLATGVGCQSGSAPNASPRLALSPPWVSIEAGDTIVGDTVRLTFLDGAGAVVPANQVTWSSSDTAVARVETTGRIRARHGGVATVRGAVGDVVASQGIAVTDPVLVGAGDMGTCLPPNDRLTASLLDSLAGTDESVQEAWDQEVARRIEDLRAGKAVTVPWEELHRELLAMVNER